MGKKIIIDELEFDAEYSDVDDIENLNYFLEKIFNKYEIKDYISRRHPEIFPSHIGLVADADMKLHIVRWKKGNLDPWGEYDNGWSWFGEKNPENFINDILTFYKENNPSLYNFIKNRIQL